MKTSNRVQPVPKEYGSVTPFIITKDAGGLLEFLKHAFGAKERTRMPNEDGTIGHAEVWIGDSIIMLFDAKPDWPPTPAFIMLYVPNCNAVHKAAMRVGATEVTPLSDNAWGDRSCRVRDPLGNIWWIQTRKENVSEEEMLRRMHEEKYIEDMQRAADTLDEAMKPAKHRTGRRKSTG
jgi:PhnB protein